MTSKTKLQLPNDFEDPILVYLDTHEFSNLANTKRHNTDTDLPRLLEQLREFKDSRSVKFVCSPITIAESLPLRIEDVPKSLGQVRLIEELCENNKLTSYHNLIKIELSQASTRSRRTKNLPMGKFEWLPSILIKKLEENENHKTIDQEANFFFKNSILDKGSPQEREEKLRLLKEGIRSHRLKKIRTLIHEGKFSHIHENYHKTLIKWTINEAPREEMVNAYLESWSNLEWIVRLHPRLPDISNWFRDAVRAHTPKSAALLQNFVNQLKEISESSKDVRNTDWSRHLDNHIKGLVKDASIEMGIQLGELTAKEIREYCPGISTEAGVIWELARTHYASHIKREITSSATADAMHAAYAPYVDIFRTDKAAAPHVIRARPELKISVVQHRNKLIERIKLALSNRTRAV